MGDRCYVWVCARGRHARRFDELTYGQHENLVDEYACADCSGEGRVDNPRDMLGTETCLTCAGTGQGSEWVEFEFPEGNYGLCRELEQAASEGLTFYGFHGEGGNYGPMEFAALEGEYLEVASHDGTVVVRIDDNGDPKPEDVEYARRYKALEKRVLQLKTQDERSEPHADS